MQEHSRHVDRPFLIAVLSLVLIGGFIFMSASLGLLARDGAQFSSVAISQLVFGVCGGLLAMLILARIPYRMYRTYAPHLFVTALVLTALVFVPGLGKGVNGAYRWIYVGGVSFQPSELLKVASVLMLAYYYSINFSRIDDLRYALGGLAAVLVLAGVPLILQPDTGTFLIVSVAACSIGFAAGIRARHIALLGTVAIAGIVILAVSRPYLMDRVATFLNPASDPQGAGYQIKQSLIAIGSGGWVGRGFGQSVQKFSYLPEPIGDSIFSVYAEEFGFVGCVPLLLLILFITVRGLTIAARAPDRFGGLTIVGIVMLFITQSFMNIGSMVGIMPLTGEPLTFISHGGTALLFALAGVGIILNVSRNIRVVPQRKRI